MKKLALIIMIIASLFLYGCNKKEDKINSKIDYCAVFKNEYEELNNKDGYTEVNTFEGLEVEYLTTDELLKKVEENKTINLVIGNSKEEISRIVVANYLEVMKEKNIKKLYYLDLKDIGEIIRWDEKNKKPIIVQNGTEDYYKLYNLLEKYLDNLILFNEDNTKLTIEKKTLYSPSIVAISHGKVMGITHGIDFTKIKSIDELKTYENNKIQENIKEILKYTVIDTCVVDEPC